MESSSRSRFSGIKSYDGAGTMTGIFSGSTNGVIDEDVLYTGTYTVNPDCTSELTTVDPVGGENHYDQFVDPSGDEFEFVQTDEGIVVSGSERRVSVEIITFGAEAPRTP